MTCALKLGKIYIKQPEALNLVFFTSFKPSPRSQIMKTHAYEGIAQLQGDNHFLWL